DYRILLVPDLELEQVIGDGGDRGRRCLAPDPERDAFQARRYLRHVPHLRCPLAVLPLEERLPPPELRRRSPTLRLPRRAGHAGGDLVPDYLLRRQSFFAASRPSW